MTTLNSIPRQIEQGSNIALPSKSGHKKMKPVNVGTAERTASTAAGVVLALFGVTRRSVPGLLLTGLGAGLISRGATGHCPMYQSLGMDTSKPTDDPQKQQEEMAEHGVHIEQSFMINRSAEELYTFWRNFENLPRIMTHLESVTVEGDRKSHWVAKAARFIGKTEWDAEITEDEKFSRIAWRSLPGGDIEHTGEIKFSKALGDRGTEVHVFMNYIPPLGKVGRLATPLFTTAIRNFIREDLRNFKRLMEVGELPTIEGQSQGTCTGHGKRAGE